MNRERITDAELSEIRERVEEAKSDGVGVGMLVLLEVPKLLAEIERLRAENDRLCPIGDLDTITTLRTEIEYRDDIIADKDGEIDRQDETISELESMVLWATRRMATERYAEYLYDDIENLTGEEYDRGWRGEDRKSTRLNSSHV